MAETKPQTAPEPISEIQPHEPAMESPDSDEKIVRQRLGDFFLEFKLSEAGEDSPFGYVEAELVKILAPLPRPAAVTYDGSKQPERELLLPSEQSAAALFAVRCEEESKKKEEDGDTPKKVNPYAPIEPTEEQKAKQEEEGNKPNFDSERDTDSEKRESAKATSQKGESTGTSSQQIAPGTEQPIQTPARSVARTPGEESEQPTTADRLKSLRDKQK